jgi:hypothetical protein
MEYVVAIQLGVRRAVGKCLPWHSVCSIGEFADLGENRHALVKIGSPISTLPATDYRELYVAVEDVMTAAMPMLARLRHPALLLPGKLQGVVKA